MPANIDVTPFQGFANRQSLVEQPKRVVRVVPKHSRCSTSFQTWVRCYQLCRRRIKFSKIL